MIVVMCMGGRAGYGDGCGAVRRATRSEMALIQREASGDLEAVETPPEDCPECGAEREYADLARAEFEAEVYG